MKYKLASLLLMMGISFNSIAENIKESIDTKNAPAPIGTYSQAIKFGNSIYISGQIAVDPATGELVQGNFTNQIRQAFTNISEISKAAGGSIDDVVKLTIYLTELKNFAEVNEVMKEFFQQPYPARAVIEIKALPKNALVEIEAVMGKTV